MFKFNGKRQSQAVLDFILVFIGVLALAIGIVRISLWFHANYAKRQIAVESTRLAAGQPGFYDDVAYKGQTYNIAGVGKTYEPIDLTEDWVFKGQVNQTISGLNLIDPNFDDPDEPCQANCPDCGSGTNYDFNCPCYIKCVCDKEVAGQVTQYTEMAQNERKMAQGLRESAGSMEASAKECDDPWELCWWFGYGKTASELYAAANELRSAADEADKRAAELEAMAANLPRCCDQLTVQLQNECLILTTKGGCSSIADGYISSWQSQVGLIEQEINIINSHVANIPGFITNAQITAQNDAEELCTTNCTDYSVSPPVFNQDCYDQCYPVQYELFYAANCKTYGIPGPYSRLCDTPTSDCDEDCFGNPICPKCGLSTFRIRQQAKLPELNQKKQDLQNAINNIGSCCSAYSDPGEQMDCIASIVNSVQ
ncbi:hypothetical protein D4R78_03045 [bacterium]|nr:MAG: hypothetical protein D4R78_03045 [bacterium]